MISRNCTTATSLISLAAFFVVPESTSEQNIKLHVTPLPVAKETVRDFGTGSIEAVTYGLESQGRINAIVSSEQMLSKVVDSLGLSITDLSDVLGVERATLYNWLKGGDVKSMEKLQQLKNLFKVAQKVHGTTPSFGRLNRSHLIQGKSYVESLKVDQIDSSKILRYVRELSSVIAARTSKSISMSKNSLVSGADELSGGWRFE